jgi:pyrroline-5-carboxylate reductase
LMGESGSGLRLGIVGAGNMATAMVDGWVTADPSIASRISVTDRGSGRGADLASRTGISLESGGNRTLAENSDVIILSVKPIDIESVLREISDIVTPNHVVVSVAAGVQTATIENLLERGVPVVRFMPNVPVRVNSGTLVWAPGRSTHANADKVLADFQMLGTCVRLEERLFDSATALSGSGPAFFSLVVEAFEDAAIVSGLSAKVGRELAVTTMVGTAEMLRGGDMNCGELRRMVTSPGGTAAAGLAHMERTGMRGTIIDAVVAARERARELG